jgi:protein-tyrosine phosphatase
MKVRTSDTHPLQIATLRTGSGGGMIGITFAPGKVQPGAATGNWKRDLAADLDVIAMWPASAVVTLLEPHELTALQIDRLGEEISRRGIKWFHLPIADYGIPGQAFQTNWPATSSRLRALLGEGRNVLVHCKGGLGRAGMVAARLLVELGWDPEKAIHAVRTARPCAIETVAQEQWVIDGVGER